MNHSFRLNRKFVPRPRWSRFLRADVRSTDVDDDFLAKKKNNKPNISVESTILK